MVPLLEDSHITDGTLKHILKLKRNESGVLVEIHPRVMKQTAEEIAISLRSFSTNQCNQGQCHFSGSLIE